MLRRAPSGLLCLLAALTGFSFAARSGIETTSSTTSTKTTAATPCVATSPGGSFYDLRPDVAIVAEEGKKAPKGVPTSDYFARGYDYGSNFTLNICGPVVKPVKGVVGVDESLWRNVSAYYEAGGKIYSLGYGGTHSRSHTHGRAANIAADISRLS
jgi:cation-dependent mannose-6-phosphate receptor